MNVMNRKLFANRDARRKLANMGGIIASSPELLGTAQTFENGGQTFSSIFSRLMAPATYNMSRLGSLDEPTQTGLDDIETTSKIAQDQMAVLSKAKAGETLGKIAKDLALDVTDVINIIAGGASLLATELTGLAGDVAGIVTSAVNQDAGKFILEKAQDVKDFGRGAYFDEGKTLPRLVDTDMRSFSRAATIEEAAKKQEELKQSQGLTTPEQRAKIAAQSDAAIKRASPETLRDTGESVGFTGTTDLLSATPKSGVMSSLGGSEVLFDLLQGRDTVPDKTASVGFEGGSPIAPPVRSPSGFGEGIMSQAPGISVPNVDIGEAGLERAREIAERDAAIKKYLATSDSFVDALDEANQTGGDRDRVFTMFDRFGQMIADPEDTVFKDPADDAIFDVNKRAMDFIRSDTSTPREEIYSDLLGGDPRAIARYQESTPEEVQAISDRLAREAAADEAAKVKQQFGDLDAEAQAQRDAEIAEQQAMLDDDDATLNPSQKIVKEFQRQVDVLKKERADRKKVEEDQGFYTEEDEKIPVKNPEFQELLKGPSDEDSPQEEDSEKVIEKLDKAVDDENKKTGGGSPANAGANIFLDAAGVDSSNMTLKDKVTSMKEIYTDLLGYDDEDESELFWLNMAQVGFLVASGQDPNALSNIAAGFAQGASKFAEDKRDKKARDDKMTLAAFSEVMADERAKTKFGYDMQIAAIRAAKSVGTQEPFVDAVRVLAQKGLDSGMYETIEESLAAADAALRPYYTSTTATGDQAEETVQVVQDGQTITVKKSELPTQKKVLTKEG
jgi:hypothetical protein